MLYSTKRKWDKLITNAAAPVPPPTSSSAASPPASSSSNLSPPGITPGRLSHTISDLDLKKRRLADAGLDIPSTPPNLASVRAVSPSSGSAFLSTTTTTTVHSVFATRPSPSYAPWDRDAFLARLETFRFVDKWPAKPSAVNEVAWAKRGWTCVDKNRVRCGACRREVYVGVEAEDESTEEGKALVERVAGQVVSEHEEGCLWRRKGCDETIHRLPLTNPATAIPSFTARYTTLCTKATELPESVSHPNNLEPSGLHWPTDLPHPISESAAVLALFGWEVAEPGIPSLITCSACFRRLGLWLFRRDPNSITDSADDDGEPSMTRLDPLAEHRDYCPWINSTSQSTPRGLAGWEMLAKILERPPRGSGGGAPSVRSTATSVGTMGTLGTDVDGLTEGEELTPEERDKRDESRMKKLRRLKGKYFGKSKKKGDKEKDGNSRPGTAFSGTSEGARSEAGSVPPTPTTPKTPRTPKR